MKPSKTWLYLEIIRLKMASPWTLLHSGCIEGLNAGPRWHSVWHFAAHWKLVAENPAKHLYVTTRGDFWVRRFDLNRYIPHRTPKCSSYNWMDIRKYFVLERWLSWYRGYLSHMGTRAQAPGPMWKEPGMMWHEEPCMVWNVPVGTGLWRQNQANPWEFFGLPEEAA